MAAKKTIRRGSKGEAVARLQHLLVELGYTLAVDGDFGPRVEATVRSFQKKNGLTDDGIVGPNTWEELEEVAAEQGSDQLMPAEGVVACIENVPYFTQRDNSFKPNGTCNVTSLAMVLSYYGIEPKEGQLEDELFQVLQGPEAEAHFRKTYPALAKQGFNPRNVHGMLVWLAERYGMKARFSMSAPWIEIHEWLRNDKPVIVSGNFTGSGHIVLAVGYTDSNDLIVHDPWGDWTKGYRGAGGKDGAFKVYPFELVNDTLKQVGKDAKWAHFIEPA